MNIVSKTFVSLLFSGLSVASPYPSDYPLFTDCQAFNYVEVCRTLQIRGTIALDIRYRSWRSPEADPMKVWLRVRYSNENRDQKYEMTKVDGENLRTVRITNGCIKGKSGGCEQEGSVEMKRQLYWTQNGYRLNELRIELAFEDTKRNWDSREGRNFHFWFPERDPGE